MSTHAPLEASVPDRPVPTGGVTPKLYSVGQTALALGVSARTVWRLIGQGELTKVNVGRAVRVSAASIDNFIKRGGAA
jgi:excisionase family DNA binding protein